MKSKAALVEIRVALIFLRVGFSISQSGDIFSSGVEKENSAETIPTLLSLVMVYDSYYSSSQRVPCHQLLESAVLWSPSVVVSTVIDLELPVIIRLVLIRTASAIGSIYLFFSIILILYYLAIYNI